MQKHDHDTYFGKSGYADKLKEMEVLGDNASKANTDFNIANDKIKAKIREISTLKDQLKDETLAADQVNQYLKHFLGATDLSLQAEKNDNNPNKRYKFSIFRGKQPNARHLSEGECSLIAFCYFMARLKGNDMQQKPIIWIDDPICSLDSNHIFFIYSLIKA